MNHRDLWYMIEYETNLNEMVGTAIRLSEVLVDTIDPGTCLMLASAICARLPPDTDFSDWEDIVHRAKLAIKEENEGKEG